MAVLTHVALVAMMLLLQSAYAQGSGALLEQYLGRLDGNLIVCPVCDYQCLQMKGSGNFQYLYSYLEWLIRKANENLADAGLPITFVIPSESEYTSTLESLARYNLHLSQMGNNVIEANNYFWNLKFEIFAAGGASVFQQLKQLHGCELAILVAVDSDPVFGNTLGAAPYNGMCGGHSFTTVSTTNPTMILTHEIGHLLGLNHVGDTMPSWLTPYIQSGAPDAEGDAMLATLQTICSQPQTCGSKAVMDSVPEGTCLDECSKAVLSFNSYLNDRGLSDTMQCLLD